MTDFTKGVMTVSKVMQFIKRNSLGWFLILPVLLCLILIKWYPIVDGVKNSFFASRGYEMTEFVGFDNYIDVFSDTLFLKTLLNTIKYVLFSLVIGVVPPILIAFLLNEVKFINKFFRVATYLPYLAPTVAIALIFQQIYLPTESGLLNMILGWFHIEPSSLLQDTKLVIPLLIIMQTWQGAPGSAVVYLAKMQEVRTDLYEAALIDGAGLWKRFWTVTWPTISSTVLLLVTRQIIGVFQVMEQPLLMTGGGPDNASMSLNLTAYNYAFVYMNVSRALALGVVMFLILAVFTVFYFRIEKKIKG